MAEPGVQKHIGIKKPAPCLILFPLKEKSLPNKFDPFLLSLTEGED